MTNKSKILFSFLYVIFVISLSNFFYLERGITNGEERNLCLTELKNSFSLDEQEFNYLSTKSRLSNICQSNAGFDSIEYIKIAAGIKSFEPFSLRPIIPKLVGSIVSQFVEFNENKIRFIELAQLVSLVMNIFFLIFGTLFLYAAIRKITDDIFLHVILPLIFIINIGTFQTVSFFLLDVPSYFFASVIIYFTACRKPFYLAATIALGVLVKEVLIIYCLCFLFLFVSDKSIKFVKLTAYSLIPLLSFVMIRFLSETDLLSMQYGWNISEGEIKLDYLQNHLNWYGIPFLIKVFSALGFPILILLSYYKNFKNYKFYIFLCLIMILSIIFANLLLGARVPRVIFVIFPFIAFVIAIISNKNKSSSNLTCMNT